MEKQWILLFAMVIASGVTETTSSSPKNGWNELVNGKGIFKDELNKSGYSSKPGSRNQLEEFKQVLDEPQVVEKLYGHYKERFSKSYEVTHDRLRVFKKNLLAIAEHNVAVRSGVFLWEKGVNQFTDKTHEELKKMYYNNFTTYLEAHEDSDDTKLKNLMLKNLPQAAKFNDLRSTGLITAVKDQGECNSCVMFATAAQTEYVAAIDKGGYFGFNLSVQQLMDCASPGWKCTMDGANVEDSYKYLERKGITLWDLYPYNEPPASDFCRALFYPTAGQLKSHQLWKNPEDKTLTRLSKQGVLVTGIYPEFTYEQGILGKDACEETTPFHLVAIVGYGCEKDVDYWIVKNSWGTDFGENGYMRVQRNPNVCGIGQFAFTATGE